MKSVPYSIALDIGTNSVGWAVTDESNNLLKYKKKNMWGVRLFDEGRTAQSRRLSRAQRRRYVRRRYRIELLQELMGDLVAQKDPCFFMKLKESFVQKNDSTYKNGSLLFNEKGFNDSDYYTDYKTIYHLRHALSTNQECLDIRLVYLAIHHIIKYRGNFIYEGKTFNFKNLDMEQSFTDLIEGFNEQREEEFFVTQEQIQKIVKVFENVTLNKSDKKQEIVEIVGKSAKNKAVKQLLEALIGTAITPAILFETDAIEKDLKFKIDDEEIEAKISGFEEWQQDVINQMKQIYEKILLNNILGGNDGSAEPSLSLGMIKKYEKHKEDLKVLKWLIRKYFEPQVYKEMFSEQITDRKNYTSYMTRPTKENKTQKNNKESFYLYINSVLKTKIQQIEDLPEYIYIQKQMQADSFLTRQTSTDNSVIPYQVNKDELKNILERQSEYYPELKQLEEKIIKLLEFRIPYYVGPLNTKNKDKHAWVERYKQDGKEKEGKITPWNFDDLVNKEASAELFIKRMTNKCTYLPQEDVLPKYSLLYSRYEVMNEINKIRVNEKIIPNEIKLKAMNTLFLDPDKKSIKEKDFVTWLIQEQVYNTDKYEIKGYQKDKEFATSLESYKDFTDIFGEINVANNEMIEEIIKWVTLFGDKGILEKKINTAYKEVTAQQMKKIKELKYKGWGRLSQKLLTGIQITDSKLNKLTIMDVLEKGNVNLMQIINDTQLGFDKLIAEQAVGNTMHGKITDKHIEDLQGSPALKKGIRQTVRIVEEIVHIMGGQPKNIYVEFARSKEDSKRTNSKLKRLIKLYEKMDQESKFYNTEISKELKKCKTIDRDWLYLYFIQNGKCMYTGKALQMSGHALVNCQIDHIIPQCYIKDDSIENRVLVTTYENQDKGSQLGLNEKIRNKQKGFWEYLYKTNLIGDKKYNNLLKSTFDEKDLKYFINRQLVETRQITKHVVNLLDTLYQTTKLVTIKAQLISDFRHKFSIYKNRDVNDYHHAHDAYLAAVVGSFIQKRFPSLEKEFIYNEYKHYAKKLVKQQGRKEYGYIIECMAKEYIDERTGEVIWNASEVIKQVNRVTQYKDCYITRKLEEGTKSGTGELFNATVVSRKSGEAKIPLRKDLDIQKYGGYSGINTAYFSIIEAEQKKKRIKRLIAVPMHIARRVQADESVLIEYCEQSLGYTDIVVIKSKIFKYQLIERNKQLQCIVGENEQQNATQLLLDKKQQELLYEMKQLEYMGEDEQKRINESLNRLYGDYISKLENYYPSFKATLDKLKVNQEEFNDQEVLVKKEVIEELLKLTKSNGAYPALKKYKIGKKKQLKDREGRNSNNKLDIQEIIFIYQSITGMYETRRKY